MQMFKSHPWHGISPGEKCPDELTSFIEIIPTDTVKYEIDKQSGYLKIDRPQMFSNVVPALYGFVPQTYCAENVADLCMENSSAVGIVGDGDPLDICVLTERVIPHGDILVQAITIGGFRMIDNKQADDKIIAVLKNDHVYGAYSDVGELPENIIKRLVHYFMTYKLAPGQKSPVEIAETYNKIKAHEVIKAAMLDYKNHFGSRSISTLLK
jgi:inorganic pyrophosphatase